MHYRLEFAKTSKLNGSLIQLKPLKNSIQNWLIKQRRDFLLEMLVCKESVYIFPLVLSLNNENKYYLTYS